MLTAQFPNTSCNINISPTFQVSDTVPCASSASPYQRHTIGLVNTVVRPVYSALAILQFPWIKGLPVVAFSL